ncbi:nuclease-related domain-containing protein [Rhodococcus sp. PD04]|uniref:nuclease-related domain-containing protein n=1 Tax=Rhodococcus sp. PD04 TaxID=3109594 RepID=UPI002DDC7E29|nr:nuclease-related domain-containing protein [Rhodococcus sp. PD04]WSE25860.1 nuclease-related domain-containing protein [Rhodococcus sp. PD04]
MSTPDAHSVGGDNPALAGQSLRNRSRAQRRALRTMTGQLIVTASAITATVTTIALLFVLPLMDALAVGTYSAAALAAAYALITFPRRAAAVGFAFVAAALVFTIGQIYELGAAASWAAALACAVTSVAVFSTRRTTRTPYLPTVAVLTVIVTAFWATAALGLPRWLWVAPALVTSLVAVGWRAAWPITWRARRAGWRSKIRYRTGAPLAERPDGDGRWMAEEYLEVGADAERITAHMLTGLDDRWHVLHSRALHYTAADADHIVIGPAGVLLIDSKYRSGHFEARPWVTEDGTAGSDWFYNGQVLDASLAQSAIFEADRIAWAFHADGLDRQAVPIVLAIHGARMNVPWGEWTIELLGDPVDDDSETPVVGTRLVTLVDATHLVDYLTSLPARRFTTPTKHERATGRRESLTPRQVEERAQRRYVRDLAAVCEHVFVPVPQ